MFDTFELYFILALALLGTRNHMGIGSLLSRILNRA